MSANATETISIARRYATAIFAQACEANKENQVVAELSVLAAAIEQNDELGRAFSSPLVSRQQKSSIAQGLLKSADALTKRSVEIVTQSGRADVIPQIALLAKQALARHRGERSATVTSARALSSATQQQLQASLARATGKPTAVTFAQDPALLGGLVVTLGSLRLDASLAGALQNMRGALLSPATI